MTKVKIIGTDTEFIIESPNEIYHDPTTGLSALVCDGKLINAPTSRLLVVCDIKKDTASKAGIVGKEQQNA